MDESSLGSVVQDVYAKTFQLWTESRAALTPAHDRGFKILYGPPRADPESLIVGFQPGGDAGRIKEEEMVRPSIANEYLTMNWPLAVELRNSLGQAYLENTLGTIAVFFRSPSVDEWNRINPQLRRELEAYSVGQVRRLIDAIRPKHILILGWDALRLLAEAPFREALGHRRATERRRRKRLLQTGEIMGIRAFAIPLPTAFWKFPPVTQEDRREIAGFVTGQ